MFVGVVQSDCWVTFAPVVGEGYFVKESCFVDPGHPAGDGHVDDDDDADDDDDDNEGGVVRVPVEYNSNTAHSIPSPHKCSKTPAGFGTAFGA